MELKKELSLLILAYNEQDNLNNAVEDCIKTLDRIVDKYEIIIIDDASKDRTYEFASKLVKKHKNLRLITHKKNKGFGSTQKTGFENSKYDLITYVPGDYQVRIDAVEKMLPVIDDCDIVASIRAKRQDPWNRRLAAKLYKLGLRVMFGLKLGDVDSIKLIKKKVIEKVKLESDSSNVDVELMVKAKSMGFKIREVEINHYPRIHGTPTGNNLKVIKRQFKDLLKLWWRYIFNTKTW
jgi:dolichol-phosphate mannosyltransferase